MKRRTFSADFKARVAKAALKNDSTAKEIAARFEIHPMMVAKWKKQASDNLSSVFDDKRSRKQETDHEEETRLLYEEIGKLKMKLDWLKKNAGLSPRHKRQLIDLYHPELNIREQCEALGIPRSTYYYKPARESEENLLIMRGIDEIHLQYPFYGYRKIKLELADLGYEVNEKRVRRLMQKMGIEVLFPKKKLSIPAERYKQYPYLLRGVTVEHINHVWSTDITYIPLAGGFLYLVAVMDWFSRYVLSWELSNTLDENFCLEALERALQIGTPKIFNSDQGSQFTGYSFTNRLEAEGISISWDGKGRALDNVFIERLWRSLKYEKVYPECFSNVSEAHSGIRDYFVFYNEHRRHQSLNYATPFSMYYE